MPAPVLRTFLPCSENERAAEGSDSGAAAKASCVTQVVPWRLNSDAALTQVPCSQLSGYCKASSSNRAFFCAAVCSTYTVFRMVATT